MPIYYNPNNKPLAQELRKNMTKQERHLWYDFLSGHPVRFRRQKQFGRYIVDFIAAVPCWYLSLMAVSTIRQRG